MLKHPTKLNVVKNKKITFQLSVALNEFHLSLGWLR